MQCGQTLENTKTHRMSFNAVLHSSKNTSDVSKILSCHSLPTDVNCAEKGLINYGTIEVI